MSDHLPECPYQPEIFSRGQFGNPCICDRLRACEQRTLSAARDAVAALPTYGGPYSGYTVSKNRALAAIDALRGDA